MPMVNRLGVVKGKFFEASQYTFYLTVFIAIKNI